MHDTDGSCRILIIDDEISLLHSLTAFLEDEGFSVWGAVSGEAGLAILERERMDGVIVDMRLPGIDGNETIVKAHAQHPSLQFIIHTGATDYQLPSFLKELGLSEDVVFIKPLADLAVLSRALRCFCR